MASDTRHAGQLAEQAALDWLTAQGVVNITCNFHCRFGEIDIIGMHQQQLVFFEVRLRQSNHFGGAAASVTLGKQQKIIQTAQMFLQQHSEYATLSCRFDVIAVSHDKNGWQFEWLQQAFYGE